MKIKPFLKIVILISIFIIVYSIYMIMNKMFEYNNNEEMYKQLRTQKNSDIIDKTSKIETFKNPINFDQMHKINDEYIGWITIEKTNIDYPIVQTNNDSYYLKKSFNKENSNSGCIFLSSVNNNLFQDKNSIIYGHNMKNGTMFGDLKKYQNDEMFFNNNDEVWIFAKEYTYKYRIFSVYIANESDSIYTSNIENFDEYIDNLIQKSIYKKDVETYNENIITMSTCTNTNKNERLVVNAILQNEYKNVLEGTNEK